MYTCKLCRNDFKYKCKYDDHINRKYACVSTKQVLEMLNGNTTSVGGNNFTNCTGGMIAGHDININFDIKINRFGDETVDYLDCIPELINTCWDKSVLELVKNVYVNKDHPENHTILLPNVKSSVIKVSDGEKLIGSHFTKQTIKVIENKIKDACKIIISKVPDPIQRKKLEYKLADMIADIDAAGNYHETEDNELKQRHKNLVLGIKDILCNNKEIIRNTHRNLGSL